MNKNPMPPVSQQFSGQERWRAERAPRTGPARPPSWSVQRRHSAEDQQSSSESKKPARNSSSNRFERKGLSPKSRSNNDLIELRASMSPSPEPRNVVLDSDDRSRPLQRYYYPGKSDRTFHIALPNPDDDDDRKPLVSRSCPPIPTINVDQFYHWLDKNEFKPQKNVANDPDAPEHRSPSLVQWASMSPTRLASSNDSNHSQSPSVESIHLSVPPRSRCDSGGSSTTATTTSGSWPDLSELANIPLSRSELELHEVAGALHSIGHGPSRLRPNSPDGCSLNEINSDYLTASDGGSVHRCESPAGSCSNFSDTAASFATGLDVIEPDSLYLSREERPLSGMSGSYVNVGGGAGGRLSPNVDKEDDISDLLRTIEMLESRCTMFLDDWIPPSSSESLPIHSHSPIISHTMSLLSHGPRGLGLEISGGIDSKTPVVIDRVDDESPLKGKVFKGDYLWIINGEHVQGLRNAQIMQLLVGNSRQGAPEEEEVTVSVLPDCSRPLEASIAEIEAAVQSRSLAALYNAVPRYDTRQTHLASKVPTNHEKNRYSDIVAYDSTRVLLTPNEFNGQSDYINANHVNMTLTGSNTVYRYIATQGPKSSTVSDFWQMVLEQGSRLVVMLTTLHEGNMAKCFKYWPDEGAKIKDVLGAWTIRQLAVGGEGAWIHRRFELKNEKTGEERHVTHLQYVKWPDHGVPHHSQDFVDFVHLVREFRAEAPLAPIIVHCSAGVGRTGVFIMMETAMGLIEAGHAVRPQQLLQLMREQRPSLVQTEAQFSFVVKAILRVFIEGTVQPCS